MGKKEALANFAAKTKVPHIILATLMVASGVALMFLSPTGTQPYIFVKLALVLVSIPVGIIGMKRDSLVMLSTAMLILIGIYAIGKFKPAFLRNQMSVTVEASGEEGSNLKEGQALYEQYCVLCHGGDGNAGFQGAKSLTASVLPDAEITNMIRNGKGLMPGNPDLSDDQIAKIKAYVKYLRK